MAKTRQKGETLTKTTTKAIDRCYIHNGCIVGGVDDSPERATKGTIVATQEFSGDTYYHVLIDGKQPPGFWYAAACIIVKQGTLRPLRKANQAQVIVRKGTYEAKFRLDQFGVASYIDAGFEVIMDDDTQDPT